MTIQELNEKWSAPTKEVAMLVSDPLHIPQMSFTSIENDNEVLQGNRQESVKLEKGDIIIECDDGNESSWGTLAFRWNPIGKGVMLIAANGRDCWADGYDFWDELGNTITMKRFTEIMENMSNEYKLNAKCAIMQELTESVKESDNAHLILSYAEIDLVLICIYTELDQCEKTGYLENVPELKRVQAKLENANTSSK